MYEEHIAFTPPRDAHIPIWRYMDLARLVSLLHTRTLWFARADTLNDPHEGALGPKTVALRPTKYPQIANRPEIDVTKLMNEAQEHIAEFRRTSLGQTFVNCWHMSTAESMAMWSIYGASGQGVAIGSTYERLRDSLRSEDPTHIGTVTYIDPETDPVPENNLLAPFLYKRSAFEYEHELRGVILGVRAAEAETRPQFSAPGPLGLPIAVDLEGLVTEVVVAPGLDQWLVDVITEVVRTVAPNLRVRRSRLDVEPVY